MLEGTRVPENDYEHALLFCIDGTALPDSVPEALLTGVESALASYDVEGVRMLFDACLLGKATVEELGDVFGVSAEEAQAYAALFFDRSVFINDFHVIAWIASIEPADSRTLLKEAYTKGFRTLRFQYAAERHEPAVADSLSRILEADARTYVASQHVPLGDSRYKDRTALGKHVITTAQALAKITDAKDTDNAASSEGEFVIKPRPPNPTLEELVASGGKLVH